MGYISMTAEEIIDEGMELQITQQQAEWELNRHGHTWKEFTAEVDWNGSAEEVLLWLGY